MIIFARFAGIGDALLINTIAYAKGKESGATIWIATNHKEVFQDNPHVKILPVTNATQLKWLIRLLKIVFVKVDYFLMGYTPLENNHILKNLAELTQVKNIPEKPDYFGDISRECLPEKLKTFLSKQSKKVIALQVNSTELWTNNKSWYFDHYLQLVNQLKHEYCIIQIGIESDPSIEADFDARAFLKVHEVFALLKACDLFVGTVGFLMHAAAAVSTPSTIIYGGFEAPWQSGYRVNSNLYNPIPCAPCWQVKCTNSNERECMKGITVSMVYDAIIQKIN